MSATEYSTMLEPTQVSLVFIISDLMNKHTFHPISAGVFLLSASYCIAIIRREWSGDEGAEGRYQAKRSTKTKATG